MPQKTLLLGLLLLLPLLFLTFSLIKELNQDIEKSSKERLGIEYIVELRKLLEELPKYRGLIYGQGSGHKELGEQSTTQFDRVTQVIRDIDEVNWRIGKQLQISEHWTRFKAKWKKLESDKESTSPELRFLEYTHLIDELLYIMELVGDSSGLILDAHLDSHYLMDLMVRQLPAIINTTQLSRGLSVKATHSQAKYQQSIVHKIELLGVLHDEQTKLITTSGKIIQENLHLRDSLDALLEEVFSNLSKFNHELKEANSELTIEQRFELGTKTVGTLFNLYDYVTEELDNILKTEITAYTYSRNWIIFSIGLCLLVAVYLATGFYLTVIHDIHVLMEATENVSEGNIDEKVSIISRDELSKVADGFNNMLNALNESNLEVEAAKEKLETLSKLDPLTELPNRRYLEQELEKEWRRATRTQSTLAVFMLDIDYFKRYNDHYGHVEGDQCIKQVANGLVSTVNRSGDFIARYGGEEFIIVVPNATVTAAKEIAKRILQNIDALRIKHEKSDVSEYVTISIGITVFRHDDKIYHAEELVQQADEALYLAKNAGRNRYVIYKKEPKNTVQLMK